MQRSAMLCVLFVSFALPASGADEPKPSLLVSSVFADSSVVVPVVSYRHGDPKGIEYRVGVSGWTVDGQWTARRSPLHSLLFAADLTPLNAHNSDRVYEEGERREDLDYENASYRARGGVRFHLGDGTTNGDSTTDHTTIDVLLVGLYESVSGLSTRAMNRWDRPYAGLEVAYGFRNVRAERPLIAQIDGLEITVRGEGFVGEDEWTRITYSQQWGNTLGRFHLRQGSFAVLGTADDFVNRSLIGGSWDALGGTAVHGLRQGELRTSHGIGGNFGTDVRFAGNWFVGPRLSLLISEDIIQGYALNVSGTWRTVGFSGGVAIAESTDYRRTERQFYAALIVPLYRR